MKTIIRHLSIGVENPKRAAEAVAELTEGNVRPFPPLEGGYVCLWPDWSGQFVEFYPKDTQTVPAEHGATFRQGPVVTEYGPVHLNLVTPLSVDAIKQVAERYGFRYCYRARGGGPLHEVWLENTLMLELVTAG